MSFHFYLTYFETSGLVGKKMKICPWAEKLMPNSDKIGSTFMVLHP